MCVCVCVCVALVCIEDYTYYIYPTVTHLAFLFSYIQADNIINIPTTVYIHMPTLVWDINRANLSVQ